MTRTLQISLVTLGDPGKATGGYLYHRRMAEAAPDHGARLRFVSLPDRPFPLPSLYAGRALRETTAPACDALLVDSIAAAFLAPWLALGPPGVPAAAVLHQPPGGIDHGRARARLQGWLDRVTYARVAVLLVASQSLFDELLAAGIERRRLRLVPPGRDVSPGGERATPDLRRGSRAALLCVSNWLPRKGLEHLIRAFATLPASSATLHLVGDDRADARYASRIRALLADADLRERVVVHGVLSKERVASMYRGADVFVLPSFKEPYGTVWGEAMAAGLPVVGWRAGNLPYLAEDGREALLVPPGDVGGLASALRSLVEDEELRGRLAEGARRRALDFPTWEQTAELFFSAVRELVDRR